MSLILFPASQGRPTLRHYQAEAVDAIMDKLTEHRSTLLVAATGLGKTQMFSEVALRFMPKGPILVLAHRKELVMQAAERLHLVTGTRPDIEMAEEWSGNNAPIVCASLQTIIKRLERWEPNHFSLIVFDECHHSVAKSFRKPLDHFSGAKVLGVTATPDRGDKKALGKLFESVAYSIDIVDGIEQGYLVPIKGRSVVVEQIDLSGVSKTAGDLQVGQLDEAVVEGVEGIVSKTLELEPDRQGIWFFPGVKSAELACERINAINPGTAAFVCGETPSEERDIIVKDFRSGRVQHLCNCQVATEGFDAPPASMVVIGRPTLSRALYAQMVGRGLRVLPGVVDGMDSAELAAERRARITSSLKQDCVVFDFCGNSGKHTLITPEDLLGGDYSDEEKKLAKKKAKEEVGGDVIENLKAARAELKAMMAKLQSKVKATVQSFDPFSNLGIKPVAGGGPPINPHQKTTLIERWKMAEKDVVGLTQDGAAKLIKTLGTRASLGLASHKQMAVLRKYGVTNANIRFRSASKAIDYIASTRWQPDPAMLQGILGGK